MIPTLWNDAFNGADSDGSAHSTGRTGNWVSECGTGRSYVVLVWKESRKPGAEGTCGGKEPWGNRNGCQVESLSFMPENLISQKQRAA
jgi:hypothetical protein